jgi:hypothetical protein
MGALHEAIYARAGKVMWALKQKDMARLSTLVHPEKGVRFSPYTYVRNEDRVFQAAGIRHLMFSPAVYRWGYFAGSGRPMALTFVDYFKLMTFSTENQRFRQSVNKDLPGGESYPILWIIHDERHEVRMD